MSTRTMTAPIAPLFTTPEPVRADRDIQTDIEVALRRSAIGTERNLIRVTVRDAHVFLTGRLARRSHLALATRLATAVPGVADVRNWLGYVWLD